MVTMIDLCFLCCATIFRLAKTFKGDHYKHENKM